MTTEKADRSKRRRRGTGCVYQVRGVGNFWAKWTDPVTSKTHYKNLGTEDRGRAEMKLTRIIGGLMHGIHENPSVDRIRFDELFRDYVAARRDDWRNYQQAKRHVESKYRMHIEPEFGRMRASLITSACIDAYRNKRRDAGYSIASVNRELSLIRATLRHAYDNGKLTRLPKIKLPSEKGNERHGFLNPAQYLDLARECGRIGLWLRTFLEISFHLGWRREEVRTLTVGQVDLSRNTISLYTSKNDDPRVGYMTVAMRELVVACMARKRPDEPLLTRTVRRGKRLVEVPVTNIRAGWRRACVRAGVGKFVCRKCRADLKPKAKGKGSGRHTQCEGCGLTVLRKKALYQGLIPHDLRRSFATNADQAGVPRDMIKSIAGWRSNSLFERYRLLFPEKQGPKAMAALSTYLKGEQEKAQAEAAARDKLINGQIKLTEAETRSAERLPAVLPN